MTNKPKAIGTAAETAVTRHLRDNGFPNAERLTLKGSSDEGDIGHCGRFIFEVKGGQMAKTAGDALISKWIEEAEVERINRRVDFGILVTARAAFGAKRVGKWWAWLTLRDLAEITGGAYFAAERIVVRMELGALLQLLGDQGYMDDVDAA